MERREDMSRLMDQEAGNDIYMCRSKICDYSQKQFTTLNCTAACAVSTRLCCSTDLFDLQYEKLLILNVRACCTFASSSAAAGHCHPLEKEGGEEWNVEQGTIA